MTEQDIEEKQRLKAFDGTEEEGDEEEEGEDDEEEEGEDDEEEAGGAANKVGSPYGEH